MKNEKKIQKRYVDYGFGFPVIYLNVPMIKVRGAWTLDVNFNKVQDLLLVALSQKTARLTGSEIRFIRHSLEMTLEKFAERFSVTHPAVIKWERTMDKPTGMNWATEKDIRLAVLRHLEKGGAKFFVEVYEELAMPPKAESAPIKLDLKKAA
jgi:transcriptional regulator with XRE-family HTH domain